MSTFTVQKHKRNCWIAQEMVPINRQANIHWKGWKIMKSIHQILMVVAIACIWKRCEAYSLDMHFPLIFEDPTGNPGRQTYFGYSVILYSSQVKHNGSWIQIGAPRANSSFKEHLSVHEPGVVYRCSFWPPRPCKALRLDRSGNEVYYGHGMSYWDLKDRAWIGASMAVQPGPDGNAVICGPRWINQLYTKSLKEYHQLGVCYWMPADEDEATNLGITNDDAEKMLPLLNDDRLKYSHYTWKGSNVYDFGVGEAGMSIHLTSFKGRSELILGAPGILNWRGAIVLYRDGVSFLGGGPSKRTASIGTFSQLTIPSTESLIRYVEFGYLGYQVSSGKFFKEDQILYVASAPRSLSLKGQVLLFTFNVFGSIERSNIILKGRALGIQCGEYFGASLAVGDLNKDGLDDLIVGAPLYAAKSTGSVTAFEEGRVSVYLGGEIGRLNEVQRVEGNIPGARFGSAISYLGDLDSDGYGEVAIGAPLEDDGRGAVYLYHGDKNSGISSKPVQYLKARDIYPYLRGFGQSISVHPADIDRNGCPDVAVGAYLSGHAVVFRGRPVLRWDIKLPESLEHIPRNATVLTVQDICVSYTGDYAPGSIGVWRMMEVDPVHKRCNTNKKAMFSDLIHLTKGKPYCETKEIMLQPNIQNFITPIEVKIWYLLPEEKELMELKSEKDSPEFKIKPILIRKNNIEGADEFCKDCPIPQGLSIITFLIPFEVECGNDKICHSDLHVTGDLSQLSKRFKEKDISYVIGSTDILQLKLLVSNKKTSELAYLTRLYIELGEPARISQIYSPCRESLQLPSLDNLFNSTKYSQKPLINSADKVIGSYTKINSSVYITCDLDNPLKENTIREVLLGLDMSNAKGSQGMFLRAWATTSSNETNPFDNIWELFVPFYSEADITITGKADNEIYTYHKGNAESEENIIFMNTYGVGKTGSSPLEKVDVEFQIPIAVKDKNDKTLVSFLSLKKVESEQDGQTLTCRLFKKKPYSSSEQGGNHPNINVLKKYKTNNNTERWLSMMEDSNKSQIISGTYQVQRNNTLFLNCSSPQITEDLYIECIRILCEAGPFLNSFTDAQVNLQLQLNVKTLYSIMGHRKAILIGTSGFVKVKNPADLRQPILEKPDHALVQTVFVEVLSAKEVDSWVIAMSVSTGMLLLLFLTIGLSKAGFFQRKKKEEMQKQLLADETTENRA